MPDSSPVKHVLVVDDYDDSAAMLAEFLEWVSPEPITTAVGQNGAEALALAREHRPDLALLDIDMPVMNGIEAAIAIRAALTTPPMLVALTGNPGHAASMRTHQAFDRILTKPVDIEQLLALLREA